MKNFSPIEPISAKSKGGLSQLTRLSSCRKSLAETYWEPCQTSESFAKIVKISGQISYIIMYTWTKLLISVCALIVQLFDWVLNTPLKCSAINAPLLFQRTTTCNFIKKQFPRKLFFSKSYEIFSKTFLADHLWTIDIAGGMIKY